MSIAPDDFHPEGGGRMGVPRIRGVEGNSGGRNVEPVNGQLIDTAIRLVDADALGRNAPDDLDLLVRPAKGGIAAGDVYAVAWP